MGKSNWLPDDKQAGNFSNDKQDTFDPKKRYVGIRLQQGVPLLDRDWNELEDIRRYAEVMLGKYYIGNGAPDETSFKITAADTPANDFKIFAGRFLVEGFEVVNEPVNAAGNPLAFILYSQQEGAAPISVPVANRSDKVYLDVWIEEVTGDKDDALNNPQDIKVETCIRHRLNWRVKVKEGTGELPREAFHHYYAVARIARYAGKQSIEAGDITDLRRTGLTMYLIKAGLDLLTGQSNADAQHTHSQLVRPGGVPGPVLQVDQNGNVGIGTTDPKAALHIKGKAVFDEGNGNVTFYGAADNVEHNGYLHLLNSTGQKTAWGLKAGGVLVSDTYTYAKPGKNDLIVKGKVGIGTATPGAELDVAGEINTSGSLTVMSGGQYGLKTTDGIAHVIPNDSHGRMHLSNSGGGFYADALHHHFRSANGVERLTVTDGKVSIGKADPQFKLHVEGSIEIESPDNGIYSLGLCRTDEGDRKHSWNFWHMNSNYGKNSLQLWEYKTDSEGKSCTGNPGDGAMCAPRLVVAEGGNVGIGTPKPGAKLEIVADSTTPGGWFEAIRLGQSYNSAITYPSGGLLFGLHSERRFYFADTKEGKYIMIIDANPAGGNVWAANRSGGGIDYAEYFESKNGKEIKPGTSVVLDGEKIRPAKEGENPFGIISANPLIVGGVPIDWPKKYLKDEFGNHIMEEYKVEIMTPKKEKIKKERQKVEKKRVKETVKRTEVVQKKGKYYQVEIEETVEREIEDAVFKEVDLYDDISKKKIGKHKIPVMETYEEVIDILDEKGQPVMVGTGKFETKTRPKINPDYDKTKEYIPREKRPEWNCVGLLGQLPLRKGQPTAPTWIKIKDLTKDVELWLVK